MEKQTMNTFKKLLVIATAVTLPFTTLSAVEGKANTRNATDELAQSEGSSSGSAAGSTGGLSTGMGVAAAGVGAIAAAAAVANAVSGAKSASEASHSH